jgi:hypothetical protein
MERIVISGFSLAELGSESEQQLWLRGGLPLSEAVPIQALSKGKSLLDEL